ncbi:hypothetical protein RB195_019352 [Necator americanus]|uniref:Amino acid transporter n=1 Tax=Necator americanus TaxID=51031 RepID=A0ABR1CEQ6_NECAM
MKNMVSWFRKNLLLVMTIGSVVAGAFLGFAIRPLNLSPQTVMLVSFPGELLMRMLKMMILPLIISSLISGDGLPISAEPGLTHDILVSRTSDRPKACNQVTGRCKGGGLESPPANKLHMSTPKTHGTRGLQPAHGF